MEIVINIPEDYYNHVKALECIPIRGDGKFEMRNLIRQNIALIQNGTPIPKGHGRLIDADAFQKYCFNKNFERRLSEVGLFFINMFLSDAPTIIEADKESENGV